MVFAKVINVCSPALFSILCGSEKDFHLFEIHQKALVDYAIQELKCANLIHTLQRGMTILAKCSTLEGKWAKGVLRELFSPEAWEVVFVNYSITEVVKRSDIVLCPPEHSPDKPTRIRFLTCSLEGLDKEDVINKGGACPEWSEESQAYFKMCVTGEVLKVASMRQLDEVLFVDLLIRSQDGQVTSLEGIMRAKGYLQPSRYYFPCEYLRRTVDLPDTTPSLTVTKVDVSSSKKVAGDVPSREGDHSEAVDEICHLLKISREDYYALKEFESKPYEPKQYPSVEEMISDALSANCNNALSNRHHGKAGYRSTNGKTWSGRGRGLSKFVEYFDQKDLQQTKKDQDTNERKTEKGRSLEKVVSKVEEGKGHSKNGCSEDRTERVSQHKKTRNPKEELNNNKNDLKDFLFKYIVEGKEKDLCLDFIGQIVAKNSHSHQKLKQGFWWIYNVTVETKELNKHWMQNLSCFMVDIFTISRSWPDKLLSKRLIVGDFYSALKRIIGKIEAAKETRVGNEILISFMANFLSKVFNLEDEQGSVGHQFKSKLKGLISSSRLDKHVSNLFLTFLDPDIVYSGYCQAKKKNLEDCYSSLFDPEQPRRGNQD